MNRDKSSALWGKATGRLAVLLLLADGACRGEWSVLGRVAPDLTAAGNRSERRLQLLSPTGL